MYLLDEFGDMIADKSRFGAYADAIQRAVRPGDVVVDLGCGPGIFALLACRAGAKRVYAIDAGEVIHFARQLAAANGFADRIEFFHGDSRQIELAEPPTFWSPTYVGLCHFSLTGFPLSKMRGSASW